MRSLFVPLNAPSARPCWPGVGRPCISPAAWLSTAGKGRSGCNCAFSTPHRPIRSLRGEAQLEGTGYKVPAEVIDFPMRFFVTGTAGFIGFHLARRLLADGHVVQGIDGLTPYY